MKPPRDLFGVNLAKALRKLGYEATRQTGSHMRVSRNSPTEQHLTIPAHKPLKIGTLNTILKQVADAEGVTKSDLILKLFS